MIKNPELKLVNKDNVVEVKKQYMSSDSTTVLDFFRKYGYKISRVSREWAKGWQDEKKKFMDNVIAIATANATKEAANKFKIETTELLEMKRSAVSLLKHRLNEVTAAAQAYVNYRKRATETARQF